MSIEHNPASLRSSTASHITFTISDLRQRPEFFDAVADRIWQAWWRRHGVPLEYIATRLRENLRGSGIPIALVAHRGDDFLGTALTLPPSFIQF